MPCVSPVLVPPAAEWMGHPHTAAIWSQHLFSLLPESPGAPALAGVYGLEAASSMHAENDAVTDCIYVLTAPW